jgi:hypothetical protein
MTGKADFAEGDWRVVLEGPPTAGLIVVTAQRGGTFRETLAIAKAYVEARSSNRTLFACERRSVGATTCGVSKLASCLQITDFSRRAPSFGTPQHPTASPASTSLQP